MTPTEISELTSDVFSDIVSKRLENTPPSGLNFTEGDHILNPSFHSRVVELAIKPAAVLFPIVARREGLQVIFTKRTQKLKSHSGQVSFPGGRVDAEDKDVRMAALRETWEEIGVKETDIKVLGQLPDYFAGSGYQISSFVGLIDNNVSFVRSLDEVEYIFEVPLAFLMAPDNHKVSSRVFEKIERHFYEMPWEGDHIWGVTAGIVRMFYNRVFK